jgi:serum/glucocorticoid-regulated kinase 2
MLKLVLKTADETTELQVAQASKVREVRLSLMSQYELNIHLLTEYRGETLELRDEWTWGDFTAEGSLDVDVIMGNLNRTRSVIEEVLLGLESIDPAVIKVAELISAVKTGNLPKVIHVLGEQEREAEEDIVSEDELFINSLDERGWSALHHACALNHHRIAQSLLSKGASCNKESKDGWTPLQLCASNGYSESLQVLLSCGRIQVNKMTAKPPALHMACEQNHMPCISLLLEAGASMTLEDQHGRIPLEACISQEALEHLPIYMGRQEIDKALYPEKFAPPVAYSGEAYFTSSLVLDDKRVCLFLDITNGLLSRYSSKAQWKARNQPELSVPVVEIDDLRSLKSKLPGRANLWYFITDCKQGSFCYYCKDQDRTSAWVARISTAISYCQSNKIGPLPTFKKLEVIIPHGEAEPASQPDCSPSPPSSPRGSFSGDFEVNFSSFTILDELGAGTFGNVFKVVRKDSQAIYAMKQLSKQMLMKNRQLKYAIGESKIMRYLNHPFIVTLYNAFETPRNLYLVMEYCPNGDLDRLICKKGRLEEQAARFYLAEILLAIEYLHSFNVVYRDLKPANVLLDSQGHVQLADFGLAKENVNKLNPAKTFAGSPAYIAPELLTSKCTTRASDVYGLGVILYEMLTGEPPYFCEDIQELFRRIGKAKLTFPRYISNEARDFITKLLHKNPEKRPSFSQIKAHPFFRSINWEVLLQRDQMPPPLSKHEGEIKEKDEEDMMLVLDTDYPADAPRDQLLAGFSYAKS